MNADDSSPKSKIQSPKSETEDRSWKTVFLLIILHLIIALPLAFLLNIWADEASTLYTTRGGFFHAFEHFQDEKQAPLYFLILSLWRAPDGSIFFARLFSVVCGCLAIWFFYGLARKIFDERQAQFFSILFALHPFLIWASLEIRGYSLVVLLVVLLLKFFEDGFLNLKDAETPNGKARIYFVLTAVFALYDNYYSGFILVSCFVALLILRRFQAAKRYFLLMLVVLLAILPLLFIVKQQIAMNASGFTAEKSFSTGGKTLWNHALTLIFPTELFPTAESTIVSIIRIWAARFGFLAIIFLLVKNRFRAIDRRVLTFGAISIVTAAFLLAGYFILGVEYVALRHATVLFVPLNLFAAALFANILPRRSWIFFAVVFAFLFPYSIYTSYAPLAKRGDWARVAAFIEAREKPNQPIVVFQTYDALALSFHYKGANKILPDEKFFDWSYEDAPSSENALKNQTAFIISKIPPDAPEIWLATEENCQDENRSAPCRPLENFIQANYTVEETRDFYLERVRLLRKK